MNNLESNIRVRPFLRCLNIPDKEWELLKKMSINYEGSLSALVRKLIKNEWQKYERRKEQEPQQVG